MLHEFIMSGSIIGSAKKFAKGGGVGTSKEIKKRLEEIRKELHAEKISYGELAELQSLAKYIDPSDVELLEAAGIPEKHEDGGGVAKGWADADLMAKGGGVKQKGTSDTSLDKLEKAKRVGYRFTDKKAKQLHVGANAKPTEEEIKKMKHGKGVYYENRKNRSDKSRMKKLEDGGVAEGWTDADLKEKGGAAKAKKKGGGNSGMMAKIQTEVKRLKAEDPNMFKKHTDFVKKAASNLKAKGELKN